MKRNDLIKQLLHASLNRYVQKPKIGDRKEQVGVDRGKSGWRENRKKGGRDKPVETFDKTGAAAVGSFCYKHNDLVALYLESS